MAPLTDGRVRPVVVVGAGPAGLTAAVSLARHGIEVLLVERRAVGSELPRATVLGVRNMEMLRSWGLADRVLAGGVDVEMSMLEIPTAARAAEGFRIDIGYPSPAAERHGQPDVPGLRAAGPSGVGPSRAPGRHAHRARRARRRGRRRPTHL